jgi:hypothetical protein
VFYVLGQVMGIAIPARLQGGSISSGFHFAR